LGCVWGTKPGRYTRWSPGDSVRLDVLLDKPTKYIGLHDVYITDE
jgi:hypothetical protein